MAGSNEFLYKAPISSSISRNTQVHPGIFETVVNGKTRTQFGRTGSGDPFLTVFYTVPAGKTLYITNAQLYLHSEVNADAFLRVQGVSGNEIFRFLIARVWDSGVDVVTMSFPMPVMVQQNNSVALNLNFGYVITHIVGWEE